MILKMNLYMSYSKKEDIMDLEQENEEFDFTDFEESFYKEIQKGKEYQHFLNIASQMDCMLLRSFLASMKIPTHVEGEHINRFYGGSATCLTTMVFKIKLFILIDDYDEAFIVVKDYIKNKVDYLAKEFGKKKYLKVLEFLASPYNIRRSQEFLGITILEKVKQ